jgi:membrane protease YdiL (CAAX protease family)
MKKIFKFNAERLTRISAKVGNAKNLSEEELAELLKELKRIEPQNIALSILTIVVGVVCVFWLRHEFLAGKNIQNLWPAGTLGSIFVALGVQQIFERMSFRKNFQREHSLLYSKIVNAINSFK